MTEQLKIIGNIELLSQIKRAKKKFKKKCLNPAYIEETSFSGVALLGRHIAYTNLFQNETYTCLFVMCPII